MDADLLDLDPGDPVLRHSRRGLVGDVVIEVSRSAYAGTRFTWWVPLTAQPLTGRPQSGSRPPASASRPSGAIVRPDSSHTHCGDGPPMSGSM